MMIFFSDIRPTQSTTECIAQSTKSSTETFEYGSFESLGIEQPFSVTVTSNTLMIMVSIFNERMF